MSLRANYRTIVAGEPSKTYYVEFSIRNAGWSSAILSEGPRNTKISCVYVPEILTVSMETEECIHRAEVSGWFHCRACGRGSHHGASLKSTGAYERQIGSSLYGRTKNEMWRSLSDYRLILIYYQDIAAKCRAGYAIIDTRLNSIFSIGNVSTISCRVRLQAFPMLSLRTGKLWARRVVNWVSLINNDGDDNQSHQSTLTCPSPDFLESCLVVIIGHYISNLQCVLNYYYIS